MIIYDEDFIASLNPVARDFVYAHECYHLSSGDAETVYLSINGEDDHDIDAMERNADCAAAHRLRDEFGYTRAQMETIEPMIRRVTGGRRAERERIDHIMSCYAGP